MDLGSMLNTTSGPTNMNKEAISLYRRLSTGSTSASPAQSPVVTERKLSSSQAEGFRAPELPNERSTPPKRKIDQVEDSQDGSGNGARQKVKQDLQAVVQTPTSAPPPKPKVRIDASYDGSRPLNDLTSLVKDALLYYLTVDQRTYGKLGIEVEAKLGRITDRDSGQRIHDLFPVDSNVLLHHGYEGIRFESNMTDEQHSRFNRHLNREVEIRNPKHAEFDTSRPKMTYLHTRLTDEIYPPYQKDGMTVKPRVTMNDADGSVVEIISKENITHLNIICPRNPFDIRVSINLEHKIPAPVDSSPITQRKKDRLSYRLPNHQIDLTKVGDGQKTGGKQSFELEVEMTDMENLKRQAEAFVDERGNYFEDLVTAFMGTVMKLNRVATTLAES
ncbi:protein of unknown function [Taphrina deformans PYCC 5710]|uniref:mRNA-capping enzyme subunit beta n=1 Tax=Taphrina deformans (strain PYCC 5710 / ATCC 11124 / CBS 356.35 / IMI 108563 / JCM 9778 / NBRC 8474) TaxID=1097556 RepID=R4XHF3_TAPDE|nr:protein of unknown function [Taphrina deformans PYCC 5710]|eukprot:CCG83958.1 protein of unknown function [Taphrina deformans PYCC 5710]